MKDVLMNAPASDQRMIAVGRLHGAFGVRGEVKLESFTAPDMAIARYQPWTLRDARGVERQYEGVKVRCGGKGLIAVFPDITDRDAAEALRNVEISVPRSALPPPAEGEYYWVDLEGMRVCNQAGIELGRVAYLFNNGANDVIVVQGERERMLPFVQPDVVTAVDFSAQTLHVDWDADF